MTLNNNQFKGPVPTGPSNKSSRGRRRRQPQSPQTQSSSTQGHHEQDQHPEPMTQETFIPFPVPFVRTSPPKYYYSVHPPPVYPPEIYEARYPKPQPQDPRPALASPGQEESGYGQIDAFTTPVTPEPIMRSVTSMSRNSHGPTQTGQFAEDREDEIEKYRREFEDARGFEDDHIYFPNAGRRSGYQSTRNSEATQNLPASASILTTDDDAAVRSNVKEWISNDHNQSCTARIFGTRVATHPCANGGMLPSSAISSGPPTTQLPDCHAAILTQTAKLEQTLTRTASPATIDVVLEAERDFNGLRHRLFACTGHRISHPPEDASPQAWNAPPTAIPNCTRPCLATDRPVLLGLSLLAERVVGLLEDIFRFAAKSAQSMDQASDFVWSTISGNSGPSARRLQRSLRNVGSKPCVSPEMDSYRALRLGEFLVEGRAKSNAMGRVLKLRVKRMLNALEVLDSAKQKRQKGEWNMGGKPSGGPLDWGGSTVVLDTVTGTLLDDLMRRMESLQGAMVLL
ncbi:hypothetical protein NUW58_g1812 [Xylaria curta]|uniref:Uncharacterized protein n=1 Tax=Xylaria curta TaxID=42375 RepID=A0ACC1PJ29_9PEZI|nr:hypothetical protein NUW58_g1812 [Xylaria curta]